MIIPFTVVIGFSCNQIVTQLELLAKNCSFISETCLKKVMNRIISI